MALIHKTNNSYLRITNVTPDCVEYKIYRNKNIRQDEENGVLNEFEIVKTGIWNTSLIMEEILTSSPVPNKNIIDGVMTLCYLKMLEDDIFKDYASDEMVEGEK